MNKKSLFYYNKKPVVSVVLSVDGYAEFRDADGGVIAKFPVPLGSWFQIDKEGFAGDYEDRVQK